MRRPAIWLGLCALALPVTDLSAQQLDAVDANPPCVGDDVLIDDTTFPAGTNYVCNAVNSIASGPGGVTVRDDAVVKLAAPTVALRSPFRVDEGGTLRLSNDPPQDGCLDAGDNDGDRLLNCVETGTGTFVDADDTGTDPNSPDTDGDAIPDGDEVLGTLEGLDLPAMGTNPLRKNILLEYDWFDDALECDGGLHSHRPTAAAIAMVADSFATAPVANPDGSSGITLIQDYGQGGPFTGGNKIADSNGVLDGGVNGLEFQSHKQSHFASARNGYFHYVLLPHRYNTNSNSSGQAELPGDDMIVSLYCFGSDTNVAHTIMHELGHNLLLRHGGDDNVNWKPNYNSVMNYKYQFPGTDSCADGDPDGDGVLDYSAGERIVLDETFLDENLGTCGTLAWDWDRNGSIDQGVMADINCDRSGFCDGLLSTLRDHDDWGNVIFTGLSSSDGMTLSELPQEVIECEVLPPFGQ